VLVACIHGVLPFCPALCHFSLCFPYSSTLVILRACLFLLTSFSERASELYFSRDFFQPLSTANQALVGKTSFLALFQPRSVLWSTTANKIACLVTGPTFPYKTVEIAAVQEKIPSSRNLRRSPGGSSNRVANLKG